MFLLTPLFQNLNLSTYLTLYIITYLHLSYAKPFIYTNYSALTGTIKTLVYCTDGGFIPSL